MILNTAITTVGTQTSVAHLTQEVVDLAYRLGFGKQTGQEKGSPKITKKKTNGPLFIDCNCWDD